MKIKRFAGLLAGLLALSGAALAQTTSTDAQLTAGGPLLLPATPPAASSRPVLGSLPQPAPAAAATAEPTALALLRQLPLVPVGQTTPQLLPADLARVFSQGVYQLAGFRPDIAALATARRVAGRHSLVALSLGAAGVPAGGVTLSQRLKLLTPSSERLVAVARPATAGSHTLVVSAEPGLASQSVFVVGLEHPAEQALDYEALALLNLSALADFTATAQAPASPDPCLTPCALLAWWHLRSARSTCWA